ncbi:MAG: NADH-quinone oxidoreductase subunit NuoG, partial [Gammaproteobacteria bacterium]|nr:NADH-quinone oxidoreductase subunit NuoG [Gammaproteobacteria bacterium]
MATIEINGKSIEVEAGRMVIEAADQAGITIPRFCYHNKLSIAANCRMCLVEVEKAPKPLPACATPVTDGMKVFTRSPKAIAAQKNVMEFLLINHPLDCPICDQGGECELQDIAMGYGNSESNYRETKRVVQDKDLGPLIATEMTRCIHCTRCVRFGQEIAGIREMGATGRGEHTVIGTYIEKSVDSEMSGNVIDLCPVGALTSKPFRFGARSWEMMQTNSVAPHDCIGSNVHLHVHTRDAKVMRVVPRENEAINEVWISDRDRFSYTGIYSEDRLKTPMIRKDGVLHETDWNTALEAAASGIQNAVKRGGENLGVLASPSSTLEELYLLQKLARAVDCHNIDHRLRQIDFSDQDNAPAFPWLGQSIDSLETTNAALLIGSNVRKEQPIAAHRLRKASMNGGKVMLINQADYAMHFDVEQTIIASPSGMIIALATVIEALTEKTGNYPDSSIKQLTAGVEVTDTHRAIAEHLVSAENATVILGLQAMMHPQFATLRALATEAARLANAKLGYLTEGANSAGACLAGITPHRSVGAKTNGSSGMNIHNMFVDPRHAYVLMGLEPELDCADSDLALRALERADFVVSMTPYITDTMREYAHVLLPIGTFGETSGTFVNAEGQWQSFAGSVEPYAEARPGWKVLRVLGNLLEVDGFEYVSSEEVLEQARNEIGDVTPANAMDKFVTEQVSENSALIRISDVSAYSSDPLVRRATPLQKTGDAGRATAALNRL